MLPTLHLFGQSLPTYLTIISLSYSMLLVWVVYRSDARGYERQAVLDLSLAVMIGGFLGGRLMHVFYEHPGHYLANPKQIFSFWQGGFVFYGGMIGAWISSEVFLRWRNYDRNQWRDVFTPVFPLGYALGRLGCLSAGCCYGASTDLAWGITFPAGGDAPAGVPLHPTQIFATGWELILFALLLIFEKLGIMAKPGTKFWFWLGMHGLGRAIMEKMRDDFRGPDLLGATVSTWISYLLILMAVAALMNSNNGRQDVSRAD